MKRSSSATAEPADVAEPTDVVRNRLTFNFREQNLAAIRPLLERSPIAVRAPVAHDVVAAVDLELVIRASVLRVRLEPNVAGRPAFARSASLAISHLAEDGSPPLSAAAIGALRAFARHVASRDHGSIALRTPPSAGAFAGQARRLPVVGDGAKEASWSRALFDQAIKGLAAGSATFASAILVVVQPCEMNCQFCPSGDRARAVQDDFESDTHYADLMHQLAAARALGVDTVEMGGNDVLAFPRALELFHAAGKLGFKHISAQSPGQLLAQPELARALAGSPLDRVDLPIYGACAEAHDAITRTSGSFDGLCRAVDQALAMGRPAVELHTIALRSTLEGLDDLLAFGQRRFGLAIRVQMLRPNRVGEREHLDDAASLTDVAAAARMRPSHFGHDIPLCALPSERAHVLHRERTATSRFGRRLHLWDLGLRPGAEDAQTQKDRSAVFPGPCNSCSLKSGCLGVLHAYLDRFGDGALSPFHKPT